MQIFSDSPEYEARCKRPFAPPTVTLQQIHAAVPKHLLQRSAPRALAYVLRDVALAGALVLCATRIEHIGALIVAQLPRISGAAPAVRGVLWAAYWWFQGLVGAGLFCLGHDAGHGTLFESRVANDVVGFTFHSLLLLPYFSWRATHHAHHKATGSVERDENYVPYHRADYGLPPARVARSADYAEVFEETPLWTLAKVLTMCIAGWWMYLTQNAMGAKMYPKGTNHFSPGSPLFKPHQRPLILLSDMGLVAVFGLLWVAARYVGWAGVARYYLVPYLLTNHWIVMFTYLHHSDPTIPHYYGPEWTFLRGALATVDRPLLGWMGRFFFHNISHDHIAHHLFVGAPFYHGPEITKHIKAVLGDEYNYDSTNTFYAFWRSFTQCLFIEESTEGGIAFYKNGRGEAAREVAVGAVGLLQNGNQEKQADVATA